MEIVSSFTKEKKKIEETEDLDNKKTVKVGYSGASKILEVNNLQK